MKKIILFFMVNILLFGFDYQLKPIKIADGVYMFVGKNEPIRATNGGNIANSYWIKTKSHWVVFDTGPTYDYAFQAHSLIKKIAPLPIKMVFNSHYHDDHWMGDCYYKKLGVPIYATKLQAQQYPVGSKTRVLNILNKKDLKNTKVVSIDTILDKDLILSIDGEKFEFIRFNKSAHTPMDYMLYLPKRDILFTGDLLMSQRITSIRHGSIQGNLEAIKVIEKISPKVYANGHGKYTDDSGLKQTRAYLLALKKSALNAIEEDIDLDDYVKNTNFIEFKQYKLYDIAHKENLFSAYKEYEFYE